MIIFCQKKWVVFVWGTENIIKKGSGIIKPGRIQIVISPPISSQAVKEDKEENVLRTLRDIICKNYESHQTPQEGNKNTFQAK